MLTNAQAQTLKALAQADGTAASYIAAGNDQALADWLNTTVSPAVKAWRESVGGKDLFEAMNITKFDVLSGGKRDAWRLLIDHAPIDFSRNKMRSAVDDVWGSDASGVLNNLTEDVTRAENALGGTSATNSGVTALKRNWTGRLSAADASQVRVS